MLLRAHLRIGLAGHADSSRTFSNQLTRGESEELETSDSQAGQNDNPVFHVRGVP